jgi:pilus assembly protein CpaC
VNPRIISTTAVTAAYLLALLLANASAQDQKQHIAESPTPQDPVASVATVASEGGLQAAPQNISLYVGKSTLVESRLPIDRISIGLGDFAVATAVSSYEVLLNGKAPGTTSMIVWQQGGARLLYDVMVRPSQAVVDDRVEEIERQIKLELPDQEIRLTQEGGAVFLRGRVKDMTAADRALAIASILGKTVNLLYVDIPEAEPQILLRVKFASVDRNLSTQLGLNIFSTGATNTIGAVTSQQFSPPGFAGVGAGQPPVATLSDALNLFLFRPDLNLGATIRALEIKGLLEVLSEPNVLTQNGQQASFLAGGEFPFPVVQGSTGGGAAAVTIQFREFGVRLNFLPVITPRGSILLRVSPEVSALDFTNGLVVNGFSVPGLTVRNLNTAVELNPGQSFAIGGLLDNRVTDTFEKIPFLGDLPVIGKFFQSRSRNKQNTELMVIVTPEIVQPVPKGQAVPDLKFPVPFLPANTSRDISSTGSIPATAAAIKVPDQTIPIETLIRSLQMEQSRTQQGPQMPSPTSQAQPFGITAPGAAPVQK